MTGYSMEEAKKLHFSKLVHPEDLTMVTENFRKRLAGEEVPRDYEFRLLTRAGETIYVDVNSSTIEREGKIVGILGIIRDITGRKRAEQQLLQSQKMEVVGRLAGGVAHDFNNLLTAIIGFSELVLGHLGDDDPIRRDVEEIKKAGDRATLLIGQLLAFSRKQVLQPEVMDLNSVVTDIGKMLRRIIGEDITLVTILAPELRHIRADRGQIEQVIMNLAVNSRDAMPEGGKLTIKTENVTLDENYCKIVPEAWPGKFVCLSVVDTGGGIDKEAIKHIFEPFFSTKKSGTGLGLSVVYGIVKQHEGWINVYTEPGQGTTFKTYLPTISIRPEEETEEKVSLSELQGSGKRILLVEDEAGVREFASRVLRENGYIVFEAATAEEALNIFGKEKGEFHLIFSDMVLPDKTGLQLVEQLLGGKPKLTVVMSSGYTDQKSLWPTIKERGFRFLQKPYTLTDLLRAVKETIEQAE
jgi:PAS domain S-box-containing protein